MRNLILLFLTMPFLIFSQESQTITFTTKSNLFAPANKEVSNTNLVNSIRADVQTEHGDFSIMLIDYNKNGVFNDYRGCCNDSGGSDGIIMLDYEATKSKIFRYNRIYITKKYPLVINGFTYRLSDLQKEDKGIYTAKITKRIVESKEIFKSRNRLIIDKIPNDSIQYYYSKKKTTVSNLLSKEHKTLFIVSSWNGYTLDLQFHPNMKGFWNKYFKDIEIIRIVTINEKSKTSYKYFLNKFNKDEEEFFIIPYSESQKIINFGSVKGINRFIVDEKGKVITTDLNEFLFKQKEKAREYREKMKAKE